MNKEKIIETEIKKIIDNVAKREIKTNVFLYPNQLAILSQLNVFCTNNILNNPEIEKDPRKIAYTTNIELKTALIALCLSVTLINHRSKEKYTKEFFEKNILVESPDNDTVEIKFEKTDNKIIEKAINPEFVFDWMVYRDKEGRGIFALMNEKVCDLEWHEYYAGGSPIYEFARFQKKYFDYRRNKERKSKESAQESFRNAVAQQVAIQITNQQLLAGKNPMDFVNLLFGKTDYNVSVDDIIKAISEDTDKPLQIAHKLKK